MCIFYLIEQRSKFLLHILMIVYIYTLSDSTKINTIIEFVPICLEHVSDDGMSAMFAFNCFSIWARVIICDCSIPSWEFMIASIKMLYSLLQPSKALELHIMFIDLSSMEAPVNISLISPSRLFTCSHFFSTLG